MATQYETDAFGGGLGFLLRKKICSKSHNFSCENVRCDISLLSNRKCGNNDYYLSLSWVQVGY